MENNSNRSEKTIVGNGKTITDCINNAVRIAGSEAPVLITGESGTGKELFADLIYNHSSRAGKPYIKINCAAIPDSLIESELFGHVKGAYTGASSNRKGKFIQADTGTLFLDEIGELPVLAQSGILGAIERGLISQLGSENIYKTDVRIIAATNRDVEAEIKAGNIRKDLFFRINVLSLDIPPLRKRKEDIPALVDYFIKKTGGKISIDKSALDKLLLYDWPGNVRELENYIKRLSVTYSGRNILESDVLLSIDKKNKYSVKLKDAVNLYKKNYIISVLTDCGWNISMASKILGIQRTYLSRLIKDLAINKNKGAK